MTRENIAKAIESAISYVEASMKALIEKDETLLRGMVWHASAELEYALFLFYIILESKVETFSLHRKSGSHSKQFELSSALAANYELLKEAKKSVNNGELDEAYEKTWQVRGDLHTIQDILEKQRKGDEKTK